MKTYLQLVSEVLKRLREDQVGTIDYSSYSTLISTFVNDAKREVENAWPWRITNSTVRLTVPAGVDHFFSLSTGSAYVTNGVFGTDRSKMLYDSSGRPMVYCTTATKEFQLQEMFNTDMTTYQELNPDALEMTDQTYFTLSPSSDETIRIRFRDTHLEERSYAVALNTPQAELEDSSTQLMIPWRPVVNLALLYALDERGEEIGEPGSKAWRRFETSLGDEIALDALYNSYRTNFTVP